MGSEALGASQTTERVAGRATSGFPSPAEEVAEASLDLHALLVRRPAATFFLRMRGDAMRRAGVYEGDLLVVDRSLRPTPGRLVVLATTGEGERCGCAATSAQWRAMASSS